MIVRLKSSLAKLASLLVCSAMVLQLVSCGTLLYPERRGQRSGELDVAVVLMDGIGLFFFIIPGVIAYAVDISTGAIYLPPGQSRGRLRWSDADGELLVLNVGRARLNPDTLSAIVTARTGHLIRLDDPNLIIKKADKSVNIADELKRLSQIYVPSAGVPPLIGRACSDPLDSLLSLRVPPRDCTHDPA